MGMEDFLTVLLAGIQGGSSGIKENIDQKQKLELEKEKQKNDMAGDIQKAVIIEQAKGLYKKGNGGYELSPEVIAGLPPELQAIVKGISRKPKQSTGTMPSKPSPWGGQPIFGTPGTAPQKPKLSL